MTNPSDLLDHISLHDSVVNSVVWDSSNGELRLRVELGNYNQVGYDASKDPEIIEGTLAFYGVSDLRYEPEEAFTIWNQQIDGEIVETTAESDGARGARLRILIVVIEYGSNRSTPYIFEFTTTGADWTPDPSPAGAG
ncbi:hypothetical protein [Polyangium fumosum]|uniref:Uncharacterized protein n=1 Tax=Polyangium fumosum TaxID=889272 RepID=A0A4U1J7B4_9BACT|nr:hypothetical protein [Polyangium fumosum]TKD02444.1 hypothetical protein E8A74_28530 [Polyangium fumosum]